MSAAKLARAAIKIPKRIERGPTDLLRALASTVKPSEIDINLLDDPFLTVMRHTDVMRYSLAKLSGKRTARFLLDRHPEFFYRDDAEPKVSAFNPPERYSEDMNFSVKDLEWCIDNQDPVNAIVAYNQLAQNDRRIDDELLLNFFEMICYTNEEPMLGAFEIQTLFYTGERPIHLWKKDGLVNKIFNKIKQIDPPRAFSSLIAGLCKHNEYELANNYFEEFKEAHSDHGLYIEAYQCLLASMVDHVSSNETAQQSMMGVIEHMSSHNISPNLLVVNSILEILTKFNFDQAPWRTACQLVNDLRSLNIEPSLHTFTNLFLILNKTREFMKNIGSANDLLSYISKTDHLFTVRDQRDLEFFSKLMVIFGVRLNSLGLASQIFKLQMKRPKFFASLQAKFAFYDIYFRLLANTEKLENILSFYDTYVPNQFRPNAESYDAFIEALDLFQADEATIKRIGKDVLRFNMSDKIKSDAIFKKDPEYVKEMERQMEYFSKK